MADMVRILKDRRKKKAFYVIVTSDVFSASLDIDLFQERLEDYLLEEIPTKDLALSLRENSIHDHILKAFQRAWARIVREAKESIAKEVV